jgi:DNA polymerase-4
MDAFYVAVELRRRPELRGRPVWVGGATRGVVLSASYEARAYRRRGRHVLDAGAAAVPRRRRDRRPTTTPTRRPPRACSRSSPPSPRSVERVSLDEGFLDITGTRRLLGEPEQVGELIRALVADEQGIPCSVGIAPTKLIAKMASNHAKPNGLFRVQPGEVIPFLHPLACGEGVGHRPLHHGGAQQAGSLHRRRGGAHTEVDAAAGVRRPRRGELWEFAWGIDGRRVVATEASERSVGSQETFAQDTDDLDLITTELLRISARVASRMRLARVVGRTVTLSLRFADFRTVQRSLTLPYPTDVTSEIHAATRRLLAAFRLERPRLRRVGVRVEKVLDVDQVATQPALDEPERGWREAERAADAAIARFGPDAVSRATLTRRRRAG